MSFKNLFSIPEANEDRELTREFRKDLVQKTINRGRIAAAIMILIGISLIGTDILYYNFPVESVYWRLLSIIVSCIYLGITLVPMKKNGTVIIVTFTLFLMSIVGMMCGRLVLLMDSPYFNVMVTSLILAILFVYLFSIHGAVMLLIVYTAPLAVLYAYLVTSAVPKPVIASFFNLTIIAFVCVAMGEFRYRLQFREFYSRRNLDIRNRELNNKNENINRELELARNIQNSLIPVGVPSIKGVELSVLYKPMKQIGGDFYDFIHFDDSDEIGIFISDVSGHGVPAALVTSMLKTLLMTGPMDRKNPGMLLTYINEKLMGKNFLDFITAYYCIYDPSTIELVAARGGHNWPLLIRDRNITELKGRGRLLGVFQDLNVEDVTYQLQVKDKVIFFTDGIIEAMNSRKFQFEYSGFYDILIEHACLPVAEYLDVLYRELVRFSGNEDFNDDICIICMEITSTGYT